MPQKNKKILKKAKAKAQKPVAKKKAAQKHAAKKPILKKKTMARKAVTKKPVAKKMVKKLPHKTKKIATKSVAHKPVMQKAPAQKPVAAKPVEQKAAPQKASYKVGHHVVYPTHGVGKIMAEETQMIGETELRMLVISFEKDKMTLRVPVHRATAAGLRPISSSEPDEAGLHHAQKKAVPAPSRGMWSRRAQEYEAKINSGNVFSVAEVVRDLHQNVDQSERSYSERMIYESALGRLVGELAAAEGTDPQKPPPTS